MINVVQALDRMVARANTRWPELAYVQLRDNHPGRAEAAAALIRAGHVDHDGVRYLVADHRVDLSSRRCDCEDRRAPRDPRHGRLCKHLLAAMMTAALGRDFADALAGALAAAPDGEAAIEVRINNERSRRVGVVRLVGWRIPPHGWEYISQLGDEVPFRPVDLERALDTAVWRIASRVVISRRMGGRERWILAPAPMREEAV